MKRLFTLLVLTLLVGTSSIAQNSHINYSKDSRWFIGINGGGTWHTKTEVDNLIGGGYGFTFGRSFGMRPEKLFSWDLRFRYLHGWWGGQSTAPYTLDSVNTPALGYPGTALQTYQDTAGYFIPNFRTQLMSGSIELALNTNRLRENTGWNFQIFGGIGVKGYNTKADLTDASGQIYDYDNINHSKVDLLSAQDGIYETNLTGTDSDFEVSWMPSFGVGLSYQLTPWASIGISHKMSWTRSNNDFDGLGLDAAGLPAGSNDIYHYSSGGFKFHLFGGNHGTPLPDPIVEDTSGLHQFDLVDDPVKPVVQKPIVDIYDPGVSPYTVEYDHFTIRAYVHHVPGRQNISFKQNGNINNNFSYNGGSDAFQSSVVLQPGQNIFEITGWNEAGQDYESTIIIYKPEVPVIQPPIVTITNPAYSPYTTNNSTFNFAATVLNVDSKSQIKVYFNGGYLPNFTYSTTTKALYASLNLQNGTNTVTVTATNAAGSDSKTVKIIYEKPAEILPPIVNFIVPSMNPTTSTVPTYNVTASVLNVDSKNNINVIVNGHATKTFNYNVVSKNVTFSVALLEGANVIQITGTNTAGTDSDNTTIIYKKPEVPKPPIVTFIDPALNPTVVYTPSYNVTAKVLNVNSASDITLKINGVVSYNFTYSGSSQLMQFGTNLVIGSNVIEITGTNNVGSDVETTTIIYKKVVTQAPPVVTITYPATDNQIFNTPNVTLVASVLNVSSANNITVLVNGNQTVGFSYNISTKILTLPLNMIQGTNTIKITGTNTAGADSDTRLIIYRVPQVPSPPIVAFVNPPSSPYLVTVEDYQITANTTNIDSKSQITLLHNGNLIADNQYTFTSNHQILYNSQLIAGSNIFEITVTNSDGTDNALAIVTYKIENIPCIIPTVGYISPAPYSTVADPNVTIDAQINNHTTGTVVEMLLNGVSQGFMTYNSNTSIASISSILNEGSNAITVIVTNNCGTNQATFTLNYQAPEAPCVDPTVFTSGLTNITTQDASVSLQAGVSEVTSVNNLSVTVNGQVIPFVYDQGTNNVSIDAPLTLGNNAIIVTATNDCGTASLTFHVMRKECQLPTILNPSNNSGFTTPNTSMTFSVSVSNATQGEVEMLINNISQPFTFDNQNGTLSTGINLVEGNNTVVITATNSCGTATKTYNFIHEIPCEDIAVSLLNPATLVATVTDPNYDILLHVTGTFEASGISATLNGASVTTSYDDVAGNISINGITLVDGTNIIKLNLTNACSSKEVLYTITYNGCQPPVISIPGMANGAVFGNSSLDFQAIVQNSNGSGNITLTVNGTNQSFDFNDQSGLLTSTITLAEGPNTIVVSVNGCETKSETITVNYAIPCVPIAYSLMQPAALTQTVTDAQYQMTLNLTSIDNPQQITVTIGGNAHPFTYDAGTQILSVNGLTLADGANAIVVTASNDCSSETITYAIQYNGCQPPAISAAAITQSSGALYSVTASISNIAAQADIQVLLNGAPVSFVFDPQSGALNAEVSLVEGPNSVIITANGCETKTKTLNATYTIPCDPIVFSLATPSTLETSVADDTYIISLVAQHADANSISVKLNGTVVPHTYTNDLITTSNLVLIDGDNTVIVTMSNDCSNETVTYTIHHDGCDAPVINLAGNADAVNDATYNFSANVLNITNQNELSLKLNGSAVNFNFNTGTGEVTAQMQLTVGANTIVLEANACASASETVNVNYTIPCLPVSYSLASPSQLSSVVDGATTSISLNVQNVANATAISATLNGSPTTFTYNNNVISLAGINLNEGANTVVVIFGNDCSSETITYTIESDQCDSPIITVTNNNIVTNDPLYTFTCNVQNVTNGNDLQVAVNGQTVSSTFANGVLTAQMSLQIGSNSVAITANGCETVSVTYTITYEVPCNPITFTFVSPTSNDTIYQETNSILVKINAQNVDQAGVTTKLNGTVVNFNYLSGGISVNTQNLVVGNNTIAVSMTNDCSNAEAVFHIVVGEPCQPPVISFTNPGTSVEAAAYSLAANVTNIDNAAQITVMLNNQVVPFNFNNGVISAALTLNTGSNVIQIQAAGCQSVSESLTISYNEPCQPPTVTISSQGGTVTTAAFNLSALLTNVTNASQITLTLNNQPAVFNFTGGTLTTALTLNAGVNTIQIQVAGCQNASGSLTVTYSEPAGPCGPRFNPGNSDWQFCLVTPDGTFNRDDLANNSSFNYSGPATAAYFKPIAGGGDAIVNGQAYPVQNGNYYLFEGALTVDVSSSHPGSMGHWEICIQSNTNPTFGNGNNRPTSPCEGNTNGNNNGGNNNGGSNDPNFNVEGNGTVHVDDNMCATIKCLGESVVFNNSQDAFVKMQFSVDGGSSYYHFNNGSFVNGGEQLEVQAPTGSDIVLKAICTNQNENWTNTEISNTGSQYVYVLKDGDQAPNFAPSQGQASVETFLAGLVDGQGNVSIGPNDVIYLFELRFVGNYGIDYQDCVMLITLEPGSSCPAPTNPVGRSGGGKGQVYQPPYFENINPNALTMKTTNESFGLSTKVVNVNEAADVKLFLNGAAVTGFNFNVGTQLLTANLKLKTGANSIKIDATNGDQKQSVTYTVTRDGGSTETVNTAVKPVITNLVPRTTSVSVTEESYTFKATAKNVKSKGDLTVLVDGREITNFNFNTGTQEVSATLKLKVGANVVKITAKNGNLIANRSYTITLKPKVTNVNTTQGSLLPTIKNVNPKTTSATSPGTSFVFKATVGNVKSKANIQLYINDRSYTAFTYSTGTKQVSATLQLKNGANKIKLVATNGDKKVERSYTITHKSSSTVVTNTNTAPKPVITNITPKGTAVTVTSGSYVFKAKIQNVSSKANIQIRLNGAIFPGFTYSSSTGQVTAVLKLRQGKNTVILKAASGVQADQKTYTITYSPVIKNNGGKTNTGGGTKTNTGGGTKTNTGGGTKTNTGGGTKTNTGGTKTTTGGGTKTKTGGTKTTTGGTKTTTGGGTKTTTGGGTKTTTGGGRRPVGG